jgi:hypothetical protein
MALLAALILAIDLLNGADSSAPAEAACCPVF